MDKTFETLKKEIVKRNLVQRIVSFLCGVFLLALNYNLLVVPNNLNIGGTSGLAIIFKELFGLKPSIFILGSSVILLIISYFALDKEQVMRSVVGAIMYPVAIMVVEPLAASLSPYFQFQNILITIILCGGIIGVGNGLIYKAGFTTGGGDLIMKMISKFQSLTEGMSQLIENVVIVLLGGLVLGIPSVIYSIILNVICTSITDKILIGISNSKMFFIYSKKTAKIKKFILDDLKSGMTIIHTEGGFKLTPRKMLMVVVPTREYYAFREMILAIDPDAFFVITDCYEVSGGVKKEKNTFLPI